MASYAFRITGLAPTDSAWHTAGEDVHRAFWRRVVELVLIEKDAELAAGLDRHGHALEPIAESTRAKGRWRSHTGLGTADNPPLTPATILSRTRSLFTGRAKVDHAEFYWKFDEVTGKHWGRILGYHRTGGPNLPIRDVIGLSPRSLRRVQAGANKWWSTWKRNRERYERLGRLELELPRTRPVPPRAKIALPASIDLSEFTFGIGGTEQEIRERIAEGRSSGFKLPGVKGRFLPPGAPPKPGVSPTGPPPPRPPKRPIPPRAKPTRPGRGAAPPKPPAKPKPLTPLEQARRDIDVEAKRQHAENLAAAKKTPVVVERIETSGIRVYRGAVEEKTKALEELKRLRDEALPLWPEMKKKWEEATRRMYDWSVLKATRKKWEKRVDALRPEYDRVHEAVEYYDVRAKHLEKMRDTYQAKLDAALADPDATRETRYAELQKRFPNLIAPGPIADRIKAYRVGDAKIKAMTDVASSFDKEAAKHEADRDKTGKRMADLIREQADLIDHYAAESKAIPDEVASKVYDLQNRIDAQVKKLAAIEARKKAVEDRRRKAVADVIKVEGGVEFKGPDVHLPMVNSDKEPLYQLSPKTRERATEAEAWLKSVTTRTDTGTVEVYIGERKDARAHFNHYNDYMQVDENETSDVVVHEYGHGIDYRIKTGPARVVDRSLEFLAHRVGDEVAIDMKQRFNCGDPGEMGRKDKFDSVFDERRAYYVGKDYGRDATEVVSMGVQKLYNDPLGFAKGDPEYCKFILGILDGSLR